jgi:hypothetical protein
MSKISGLSHPADYLGTKIEDASMSPLPKYQR